MPTVYNRNAITVYISETAEDSVLLSVREVNHVYYILAHNSHVQPRWLFVFDWDQAPPPGTQPVGRIHLPPRADSVFTSPPILDQVVIGNGLFIGVSDAFDIYSPVIESKTTFLVLYSGDPIPLA